MAAITGPTVPKKKHSVVRWFVLGLVMWIVTAVYFFVSTEWLLASKMLGTDRVTVSTVARVELEQGDPFGLVKSESGSVRCTVAPDAGHPRAYLASQSEFRGRRNGPPVADHAWFTGGATVGCERPAIFLLPGVYSHTSSNVLSGLMATAAGLIVIGSVQVYRRVRQANRVPAGKA